MKFYHHRYPVCLIYVLYVSLCFNRQSIRPHTAHPWTSFCPFGSEIIPAESAWLRDLPKVAWRPSNTTGDSVCFSRVYYSLLLYLSYLALITKNHCFYWGRASVGNYYGNDSPDFKGKSGLWKATHRFSSPFQKETEYLVQKNVAFSLNLFIPLAELVLTWWFAIIFFWGLSREGKKKRKYVNVS